MTERKPSAGELAYEQDRAAQPLYHDGSPRPRWAGLPEIARWSWSRDPTARSADRHRDLSTLIDKMAADQRTIDHTPIRQGGFGNLPSKRPCIECPLRRIATPGRLGGYTPDQYVDVLHGIGDIACHLSPGFPHNRAEQRSCTGVAMYRANCAVQPLAGNSQAAVDHVGVDKAAVFDDPIDFLAYHYRVKS